MLLPQEIEVWYVLPALRREMCKELVAAGITQRKAAQLFGITEAAVSHYINSKRASKVKFEKKFLTELKRICEMIKEGKMTSYEGLQLLCREFRQTGQICNVHRQLEKLDHLPHACRKRFAKVCTK